LNGQYLFTESGISIKDIQDFCKNQRIKYTDVVENV